MRSVRSLRYLNSILTALTVLLALQLWTSWTAATAPSSPLAEDHRLEFLPTLATPAQAAPGTGGIPDAGAQRKEMIELLKLQVQATNELSSLLKSGQVRVRVDAPAGEPAKK